MAESLAVPNPVDNATDIAVVVAVDNDSSGSYRVEVEHRDGTRDTFRAERDNGVYAIDDTVPFERVDGRITAYRDQTSHVGYVALLMLAASSGLLVLTPLLLHAALAATITAFVAKRTGPAPTPRQAPSPAPQPEPDDGSQPIVWPESHGPESAHDWGS